MPGGKSNSFFENFPQLKNSVSELGLENKKPCVFTQMLKLFNFNLLKFLSKSVIELESNSNFPPFILLGAITAL